MKLLEAKNQGTDTGYQWGIPGTPHPYLTVEVATNQYPEDSPLSMLTHSLNLKTKQLLCDRVRADELQPFKHDVAMTLPTCGVCTRRLFQRVK